MSRSETENAGRIYRQPCLWLLRSEFQRAEPKKHTTSSTSTHTHADWRALALHESARKTPCKRNTGDESRFFCNANNKYHVYSNSGERANRAKCYEKRESGAAQVHCHRTISPQRRSDALSTLREHMASATISAESSPFPPRRRMAVRAKCEVAVALIGECGQWLRSSLGQPEPVELGLSPHSARNLPACSFCSMLLHSRQSVNDGR